MRNVILTGIPRSGTTLATALIDGLPDCVCLNEPRWQVLQDHKGNAEQLAHGLAEDFARIRAHLIAEHPVPDRRTAEGKAVTNFFSAGTRTNDHKIGMFIRAGLTQDFTLAMKHNALYLSALPHLAHMSAFTIIAVIRNPVHTIASWRRLSLPVSSGHMPHAEIYWPTIKAIAQSGDEVLVKQVKLYDAICERLQERENTIHVLPYETLIHTPNILCDMLQQGGPVDSSLIKASPLSLTDETRSTILAALKQHGKYWQGFYPNI